MGFCKINQENPLKLIPKAKITNSHSNSIPLFHPLSPFLLDLTQNLRLVLVSDYSTSVRISFHPALLLPDQEIPVVAGKISVFDLDPTLFTMKANLENAEHNG